MKIKIYFIIIFLISCLLSISTITYGKKVLKYVEYDNYKAKSLYTYFHEEQVYSYFPELETFLIGSHEISSLHELINLSDTVLLVNVYEKPVLHGNGIINHCLVKKVIKGNDINEEDIIKVYDLIYDWNDKWTSYLGGSTPLNVGDEYLIFIKEAPYPTIHNTYIFNNMEFGHIRVNKPSEYLLDYELYSQSVDSISEYDFVFENGYTNEKIQKHNKILSEVQEFLNP